MLNAFHKATLRVLLGLYVIAVFKPLFPYLEYALNKQFIAQQLCENRTRPELKCEGRCFLAKRLAKVEAPQTTSTLPLPHKQSFESDSFHLRQNEPALLQSPLVLLLSRNAALRMPSALFVADIFHPPRADSASA